MGQSKSDSIFDPSVYSTYNKKQIKEIKEDKNNIVFLNLLGNGIFYSICYERKLFTIKDNQTVNANIGFGTFSEFKVFPFQLNKTFGEKRRFEFGIGTTYLNATYLNNSGVYETYRHSLFPTLQVALRIQSERNPFYLKLGLTKFLFTDDNFKKYLSPVYPGLNLGYRF